MSQMREVMNWDEKIEHWIRLIRKRSSEAEKFYYHEIFPEVSKRFIQNCSHKNYDYLVSLVGYSERPVILAILGIMPKKVLFLHTDETETRIPLIIEKTGLSSSQIEKRKIRTRGDREIHKAIKEFAEGKERSHIIIDITGGKKSMIGAAAQSALVLKIDVGYIDGEYIHELRQPKPGTENFRILDSPSEMKPIRSVH